MTDRRHGLRLAAWTALVLAVGALALIGRLLEGNPDENYFYEAENAVGGFLQYAIVLGLTLLIALRLRKRDAFALRRPTSWALAAGLAFAVLVSVFVVGGVVSQIGDPGEEQGLTPEGWDGSRAFAFAGNLAVVTIAAPVVEELLFRGLGFSLLERHGRTFAIVGVGLAFAAWHGLLLAFPLLFVFGAGVAYIRARTGSVYPGMVFHALFNGLQVVLAVSI